MPTTEHPIIVGVFKEEAQVKSTIDMLRDAGYGNDQISYVMLKGDERSHRVLDSWVNLGLSEEEVS